MRLVRTVNAFLIFMPKSEEKVYFFNQILVNVCFYQLYLQKPVQLRWTKTTKLSIVCAYICNTYIIHIDPTLLFYEFYLQKFIIVQVA